MFNTKSELITEGLRKSFCNTDCKMANRICYGYTTAADGELTINEAEAKVVCFIFERYLSGDSFGKIATALEKQGILSLLAKRSGTVKQSPNYCQTRSTLA